MDLKNYTKKLVLPQGVTPPLELRYQDIIARPLTRKDLQEDMDAVNSSLELIRKTRGGSWPEEPVSEDFDLMDLAWHETEFREGNSYAYVVYDKADIYVGCFYLYGMGVRTELTPELTEYEVDASWWVSAAAYDKGYYTMLQAALDEWLRSSFKFTRIYYSNAQQ